jgi:pimeloyl-ACP methyl ester carboxylesterase
MYNALSKKPNKFEGHKPRLDIYRKASPPKDGVFKFKSKFHGFVRDENKEWKETNEFQIGYTQWGDKGPVCLLLHGVPTNRNAKLPIQELLSPFCRTIAIDMLGMGGDSEDGNPSTSMPQLYGMREGMSIYSGKPDDPSAWDWVHDSDYIHELMTSLYPGEKWFFQADDWGGGILSHYIDQHPEDLLGAIWVDPIAFDGYPVNEIQAFGRASMIPRTNETDENGNLQEDTIFKMAMGAADQTMVQIFKTMVFDPTKYNQYKLKEITRAYVDNDYERSRSKEGEDANSLTLRLKYDNMRTLCERAARLEPALLLPYDEKLNPKGVNYSKFNGYACVIWAGQDNMMNSAQKWRFKAVLNNAKAVDIQTIDNAGHFVETDQPERVAESMFSFMSNAVGVGEMGDICLGFKDIWKGDERDMIKDLRKLWKM